MTEQCLVIYFILFFVFNVFCSWEFHYSFLKIWKLETVTGHVGAWMGGRLGFRVEACRDGWVAWLVVR